MAEEKVLLCLIKRRYRCPTWGFRSIQGDSPKNVALGVRLYTIDFGKSPPISGRGGVGILLIPALNGTGPDGYEEGLFKQQLVNIVMNHNTSQPLFLYYTTHYVMHLMILTKCQKAT